MSINLRAFIEDLPNPVAAVSAAVDKVEGAASGAVDTVKDAASSAVDTASGAVTKAEDAVSSAVSTVQATASGAVATVESTVSSAVSTVKDTASSAINTVENAAGAAVSKVEVTVSAAAATVQDAASAAVDAVKANASAAVDKVSAAGAPAADAPAADAPAADAPAAAAPTGDGVWNPPFDLEPTNNSGDATARLVDIQRKLAEWKDVGYEAEMSVANGAIDKQLKALSGPGRPLTADEATALTAVGLLASQAYKDALGNLGAMISAELDKYTGVDAQAALDNVNELLHQEFTSGEGSNKVADLKEIVGKAKDFAGKIKEYVDYAQKAKSVIKAAEKLEGISEGLKSFTGKLSTAKDALGLASDVATLAGKVSQKPGDTANSINSLKAGLNIADFIISKSNVPIIGQWWSGYIKPCAELALQKLQQLDDLVDKSTRSNLADEWWERASKGMTAPQITDSGLNGVLLAKVFPGGQPMLDFMWSLFRGNPPDTVPDVVQKHMLKFRKQFNAGQPEADQLETDSAWYNAWNAFSDEKSPNLKSWVLKNKASVWAMQYGSLPHP